MIERGDKSIDCSALLLALLTGACGRDSVHVTRDEDYNHAKLVAAVDDFVRTARTPSGYAELAKTVETLRPSMDRTVAREAELRMMVLALAPVQATQAKSIGARVEALALTVWPTLLAPPIVAGSSVAARDPDASELAPKPGERSDAYVLRLCSAPLAAVCGRVVPEFQAQVIESVALHRAAERARSAVEECSTCTDPAWHQAMLAWESVDRDVSTSSLGIKSEADPDNWPIAGIAAVDDPGVPGADMTRDELIVAGNHYGAGKRRIDALRNLRDDSDTIAVHFLPDTTLAEVRAVVIDAHKAGCTRVAVIARVPSYPYQRKAYWVADGVGLRVDVHPNDSLQSLLVAIDKLGGVGTLARIGLR